MWHGMLECVVMYFTVVTFLSVKHYCLLWYCALLLQSGKRILLEEEYETWYVVLADLCYSNKLIFLSPIQLV